MTMNLITGRQRLTVDGTVRQPTIPDGTRRAVFFVEEATIRFTVDGTAPVAGATTVGLGTIANDGDGFELGPEDLAGLKMLRNTGTTAYVEFVYYRY